jgi:predicted Zn-ribbon and HTH transcriptional regulator
MPPLERTPRQQIKELLTIAPLTTRRLATIVGISERQIEEHLHHIVQSVARDPSVRFVLEPAACKECDFVFRERNRITRPSRCPKCRSEAISEPQYSIEPKKSGRHHSS